MKKILSLILAGVLALSLVACSNDEVPEETVVDVNVSDIWENFLETVPEDERVMTDNFTDDLLEQVYGITSEHVEQYTAHIAVMMTQADETFIAKVNEGQMDAVKEQIEMRQQALLQQWEFYLPDQYEQVQNYKLVENGDYIIFAIGYNADTLVELFNAAFEQ